MKKLKLAFIVVAILALVACSGIGVKVSDDAVSILQNSATSTVGYLIVKNNPKFRDPMVKWYMTFKEANDLSNVQTMFKEGFAKLSQSVSHDPFLTMQIQNAMSLLEINVEGPQTELDIGKYQGVVDAFMMGVMAVPYNL
jgi:hypothetical protein